MPYISIIFYFFISCGGRMIAKKSRHLENIFYYHSNIDHLLDRLGEEHVLGAFDTVES